MEVVIFKALLALFLSVSASAQQGQFSISQWGGLNDADSPAIIQDFESQDLLNVETNLSGTSIIKRKGFDVQASLTIATAPISGSFSFFDSNGNKQDIVCHDTFCHKSTNGQAFAVFLTTASHPNRWSFVTVQNKLYGANDIRDRVFEYDGSTLLYPSGIPQGSVLELSKDRLIVSDTSANPNRVHYSQSGAYTTFTGGVDPEDAYTDDIGSPGDRVTALKYDRGRLYIAKRDTLTVCLLGDQYTSNCALYSRAIGSIDSESFVSTPEALYFRGQDRNYWRISDGLEPISLKISNFIKSQSAGFSQNNTQSSQSDWQAGVQIPTSSWNTTTTAGSIFPSSTTQLDTSSANFAEGALSNLSATDTFGSITLSSRTVQDNWSNNIIAGHLGWTVTVGNYVMDSGQLSSVTGGAGVCKIETSSITISSGSWAWDHNFSATAGGDCSPFGGSDSDCFEMRFMKSAGDNYYAAFLRSTTGGSNTHYVGLRKSVGGVSTDFTKTTLNYPGSGIGGEKFWKVVRSSAGVMTMYIDGVFIGSTTADVSVASSTRLEINAVGQSGTNTNRFDDVYTYQYASSGSITSRAFDTTFSTPTFGPLSSTFTIGANATEGQVVFYTQSSNNGTTWDAQVATSDTVKVASSQKRYLRYIAGITTFVSTKTPSIQDVSLLAATTGLYRTQCIQPGSLITSWGVLSCAQTLAGTGSNVFFATSSASCATLPIGSPNQWTTQANNATVTIATNVAVYVGFSSLLGSATDQAQVDACTVYWNNGVQAPPVWGAYDSTKNAIYWTAAINNSSTNNRLLKLDLNNKQWFPFSLAANAPRIINNALYFGSSTGGFWNLYGLVENDNGSAINAYWKSKDFSPGSPFQEKNFQKISLISNNEGSGTLNVTYALSNSTSTTFNVSLGTSSNIEYIRKNYNVPLQSQQTFFNIKFWNDAANQPFEVLGAMVDYFLQPWKPTNQ